MASPTRPDRILLALLFSAVGALLPRAVTAQERTLRSPEAVLPGEFSQIRGVRELRDGRVLVTDRIEERVIAADFASGKQTTIGRTGTGPAEFHLPAALSPMPGDSTLLVDEGNSRLAVIGPDLKIHRSFALRIPGIGYTLGARGVDARGRYYLQIPGWIIDAYRRGDSVPVVRFDPRTSRVDTLAIVKGATSLPPNVPKYGLSFIAFSPEDVWAVAADGRVAVVRSKDYRVEWIGSDSRVVRGAPISFRPLRVSAADRVAFSKAFLANSPVGGRGENGGLGLVPAEWLSEENVRKFVAQNPFAETKGALAGSRPLIGAAGELWVERAVAAGESALWDVLDSAGKPMARYRLPRGRRLVALGRTALYVVSADDDGVERLERYAR